MAVSDISLHEVTEVMEVAIRAILKGATDREAAEESGVSRQTINHWRRQHPAFRAELRNRRAQIWQDFQQRLTMVLTEALKTIQGAVESGDLSTSRWILERAGMDARLAKVVDDMETTPTTPEAERAIILHQMATEEAKKRLVAMNLDPLTDPFTIDRLQAQLYLDAMNALRAET